MDELAPELRAAVGADPFANWLGATLEEVTPGYARMALVVRPAHCGPHGLTHGGTVMGLAEAALAAATHAHNRVHLALSVNVVFHSATRTGDHLVATVEELRAGGRTAGYTMTIVDQRGTLVASCQAVVYRTREAFVEQEAME